MTKKVKLDALLAKAAPFSVVRDEFDAAEPVPVPDALRERILVQAHGESARLLADSILAAAAEHGKTREALVADVGDSEDVVALLDGKGDPRRVGPGLFARLLARAGADANDLRELIVQTVAQLVVVRPRPKPSFLLRPLGRGGGGEIPRSGGALNVGVEFADEVIEEWERLSASDR